MGFKSAQNRALNMIKTKPPKKELLKRDVMDFDFKAVSIDGFELVFETLVSGKLFETILDSSIKHLPKEQQENLKRSDIEGFTIPDQYLAAMNGKIKTFVADVNRQLKAHNGTILRWTTDKATFMKFVSEKEGGGAAWLIKVEISGVYGML